MISPLKARLDNASLSAFVSLETSVRTVADALAEEAFSLGLAPLAAMSFAVAFLTSCAVYLMAPCSISAW